MRIICSLLTAAVLFASASCAAIWERSVYERFTHLAQEEVPPAEALAVNSPETLRNEIIGIIQNRETVAEIRVIGYTEDLTTLSLSALLNEIQTQAPIASFAVENMAFDLTSVLSQHTIILNIVYRRSLYEIQSIQQISGRDSLDDAVTYSIKERSPQLIVEMLYFDPLEHDVEEIAGIFYLQNPYWAIEYPEISVSLYPAHGDSLHRIIEINFEYQLPSDYDAQSRRESALDAATEIISNLQIDQEELEYLEIFEISRNFLDGIEIVSDIAEEDDHIDLHTAYGSLVNRRASELGREMGFRMLWLLATNDFAFEIFEEYSEQRS